jgi:hypothetical protein
VITVNTLSPGGAVNTKFGTGKISGHGIDPTNDTADDGLARVRSILKMDSTGVGLWLTDGIRHYPTGRQRLAVKSPKYSPDHREIRLSEGLGWKI